MAAGIIGLNNRTLCPYEILVCCVCLLLNLIHLIAINMEVGNVKFTKEEPSFFTRFVSAVGCRLYYDFC